MGKNTEKSLGKALLRSRFSRTAVTQDGEKWLHTAEMEDGTDWNRLNLTSVTEQNSLDEFLSTAELAGTQFESERLNVQFVSVKSAVGVLTKEDEDKIKEIHDKHKGLLRIPRRPFWKTKEYDAQTLQLKERESFLEWRRNLAKYQDVEHLKMTPFEKNLEFWRQLWRVIERSDVVMQIVDARNPLLFRCQDLEAYVKEIDENKMNVLLINKSDYLSEKQRLTWLRYFRSQNVKVIFWSAHLATDDLEKLDESTEGSDDEDSRSRSSRGSEDFDPQLEAADDDDDDDAEDEEIETKNVNKFQVLLQDQDDAASTDSESTEKADDDANSQDEVEEEEDNEQVDEEKASQESLNQQYNPEKDSNDNKKSAEEIRIAEEELAAKLNDLEITDEEKESSRILSREELISLMKTLHTSVDKAKPGSTTIGLVGYPNVGKSSTLNALMQGKKVAVSDTPGKTKHYQTIVVDDELVLCDCPGLVFPSFVSTRGELIINGILPIDQMRDYIEPVNMVLHHIPKNIIEMVYGIQIAKPKEGQDPNRAPTAEELCTSYSLYRGYMNHKGTPDVNRGARYILKDYVNGKLLYCYPPPGVQDAKAFQDHKYNTEKEAKYLEKTKKIMEQLKSQGPKLTNFDQDFFVGMQPRALQKGGIVGYFKHKKSVPLGANANGALDAAAEHEAAGKPWKKHFNQGKREKLRRKTSHFDKAEY